MTIEENRMKNLNWFAGVKMILSDHEDPINDTERDDCLEEIYLLTLKEFKK